MKFHNQVLLAMVLGAGLGLLLDEQGTLAGLPLLGALTLVGTLFINALKMVVVPLVTSAIISGITNIGGGTHLGRLGGKTVAYYLLTTLIAVLVGLVLANLLTPGEVDGQPAGDQLGLSADTDDALAGMAGRGAGDFAGILLKALPPNIVAAAVNGQLLGLIVFALLFGIFLRAADSTGAARLRETIDGLYETMMALTLFVIRFAPLGVFALVGKTAATTGYEAIEPLAWFFVTVVAALFLHAAVIMPLLIRLVARRSPVRHARAMMPALLTAFSSASSSATLPMTLECVEKRAGVSNRSASFVLPLGATMNMDGTALYECVAVLFIAQAYGMDLSIAQQASVVVIALLTSIGVAGIPSASLVAITVILGTLGLPAEAIGLILATDRLLDMFRTAVNVWGDSVGAVLVARSEGEEQVLTADMDDAWRASTS
ncbi:MAG: dicarboxylate/amino acid:cation symporter [Alcanivoracaceae bacterium]|nr:dicarboxylate/amino acid:cation symporter [Alcanivoracaceae bacterium]